MVGTIPTAAAYSNTIPTEAKDLGASTLALEGTFYCDATTKINAQLHGIPLVGLGR
jgi:hypothetical protein